MQKKPDIDDADQKLFRDAMRGVKPLPKQKQTAPAPNPPQYKPRKRISYQEPVVAPLSDYETLEPISSEDLVEFKQSGLQHKVLRKLRSGQYNIEAILDLHGMTVDEAKESLYSFVLQCQKQGVSHALVVHGKGRTNAHPILKNKLNHWLRQLEQVLAFCSAKSKDGRSGAMYVLLKHQKGEISS
jgi:DNA-nicking Smr family endonuclease